jgi:hypothetical protein
MQNPDWRNVYQPCWRVLESPLLKALSDSCCEFTDEQKPRMPQLSKMVILPGSSVKEVSFGCGASRWSAMDHTGLEFSTRKGYETPETEKALQEGHPHGR